MKRFQDQEWSWVGMVVLVIAVCMSVGWATALIMSASARTPPITDTVADLLSTVGGVLAGGVSAFIGASVARGRRRRDEQDLDPPEEP